MKYALGIDVSKLKCDGYSLNEEDGANSSFIFINNLMGFKKLMKRIDQLRAKGAEVRVVIESTGVYHRALVRYLHKHKVHLSIINPVLASDYAKSISWIKTDKSDAKMLALYGQERQPKRWVPLPDENQKLKDLNTRAGMIEKDIRRESNRLHAAEIGEACKEVIVSIKRTLRFFNKQMDNIIDKINKLIAEHEKLSHVYNLVNSIQGIGPVCSRLLTAEIYEGRFESASQCTAYLGLVPVPRESGNVAKASLSKGGNRRLKAALYMAAISAKKHNPQVRNHYNRLVGRGKPKVSALCGAMRKLVAIAYGVVHTNTAFIPAQ